MSTLLSRLASASLGVLLLAPATTWADILFVSDPATSTVYQVPSGGTTTGGTVYATLAGNTEGLAFDQGGNLYVASFSTQNVTKIPAGGGTPNPNFATNLSTPEGVAVDSAGNVYVANNGSSGGSPLSITKIAPDGTATTFASGFTGGAGPIGLAFDSSGNLYAAVPNPGMDMNGHPLGEVVKITPAGTTTGGTPFATGLNSPFGLAFDKAGNLYVSDISADTISKVSPDGSTVSLFASGFSTPEGLAVD